MNGLRKVGAIWLLLGVGAMACTAPNRPDSPLMPGSSEARPTIPKRITAVIAGDPLTLYQKLNPAGTSRGVEVLEELVNSALTTLDTQGGLTLNKCSSSGSSTTCGTT